MSKKIANDLIHTNAEYEKLKKSSTGDSPPRETPGGQGPGRRGYRKQLFDEWTLAELKNHARKLEITVDESINREDLIELLDARDATISRASD